ncbi:c-type cytochrome [Wohlfahrtiimonas sp. G9077]|uniref:c-type cytochrome n=1 Tax=Wohlfahrtiimonas sp. G9077 TaxID=1980118 RepID=UPI000B9832FA|nr:c-type cytochrome [Wohlfahrtiimonas sp. G9077]OYQ75195.1 cytochrome C [Wohlfahrtiimonas sp. G9077]
MKKLLWTSIMLLSVAFAQGQILQSQNPMSFPMLNKEGDYIGRYTVPSDAEILKEPNAKEIMRGKLILNDTKRLLPDHVGAEMNCSSCHIAEGKVQFSSPYIAIIHEFPEYSKRAKKVIDIEERINGCFERSMNGVPLDPDSEPMRAMVAYMTFLAKGQPKDAIVQVVNLQPLDTSLIPDPINGKVLFGLHCATCHGDDGQGMKDARGDIIFPPLWGPNSFNAGAGMHHISKASSFIKYNMPIAARKEGAWGQGHILTDQEALDIAAYFTQQPRPALNEKKAKVKMLEEEKNQAEQE